MPELTEEFKVVLSTDDMDAVLISPSIATVVITANDDQHGVISLESTHADPMYINEDEPVSSVTVTVQREGGTFGQVNTDKIIITNDSNVLGFTHVYKILL